TCFSLTKNFIISLEKFQETSPKVDSLLREVKRNPRATLDPA
ncbi:unnamed protein product, partial [Musa textilis]